MSADGSDPKGAQNQDKSLGRGFYHGRNYALIMTPHMDPPIRH